MEHSPIARRTSLLRLCATMLFVAILNVACGGDDSPSTTVSPELVQTTPAPAAEPDAPEFADAVAGQLASLTLQALRQAVGVPPVGFTTSDNPSRLGARTFRVSCPASGYMEMTQLPTSLPFIGQVGLSEVKEVYKDCSYTEGGTTYTTNGNVGVNGSYFVAENVPQQLEVSGNLSTTPGEDCPVLGRVTADHAYAGTVCAWPISTLALTPTAPTDPGELLSGRWAGRATFTNSDFGCRGTADITFDLTGWRENFVGDFTYTIRSSQGDAGCSLSCSSGGPVGCGSGGSLFGEAQNGSIELSGSGLSISGLYHAGGEWMGGTYSGSAGGFSVSGDWQAVK